VEEHSPALVFVDSFRSVMLASTIEGEPPKNLQQFVQQLGMLMTSWQATTFLIGDSSSEAEVNPVFTVADGLIWLRQSVQRNSMVRKMEIVKMRGQPTLSGLHTFRISAAGIKVYGPAHGVDTPESKPPPGALTPRVLVGIPQLDKMLGGGLSRGYSMLIAGPSGSGKSILAAAFLAEGARRGETGVIAAFEQRPSRSRNPMLAELIKEAVSDWWIAAHPISRLMRSCGCS
jgi:circadian clock protein KaiC